MEWHLAHQRQHQQRMCTPRTRLLLDLLQSADKMVCLAQLNMDQWRQQRTQQGVILCCATKTASTRLMAMQVLLLLVVTLLLLPLPLLLLCGSMRG